MRPSFLWLLLALTLVRELFFIAVVPPWQGPDELGHFEYVALTYSLGRLPASSNTEIVPELTRAINTSAEEHRFEMFNAFVRRAGIRSFSEKDPPVLIPGREAGYQQPAYYLLLLPIYALVKDRDIITQYYALAMISSLLAVITVLAAWMTARLLFQNNAFVQTLVPVLVAFWPTQTYMMSRLNNDNLATAVAAWTMWLIAALLKDGFNWRKGFALGGLTLLAAFTKGTTLFLLPLIALAVALSMANRRGERLRRATEITIVAVVAFGVTLIGCAMVIPTVAGVLVKATEVLLWPGRIRTWLESTFVILATGQQWQSERLAANWQRLIILTKTMWAAYGWGSVLLPLGVYWSFGIGMVLATIGLLRAAPRYLTHLNNYPIGQGQTLALFGLAMPLACFPALAHMILVPFATPLHGRILLTLLIPIGIFLAAGFSKLLPPRWHKPAMQMALVIMLILDTVGMTVTLLPHYYG